MSGVHRSGESPALVRRGSAAGSSAYPVTTGLSAPGRKLDRSSPIVTLAPEPSRRTVSRVSTSAPRCAAPRVGVAWEDGGGSLRRTLLGSTRVASYRGAHGSPTRRSSIRSITHAPDQTVARPQRLHWLGSISPLPRPALSPPADFHRLSRAEGPGPTRVENCPGRLRPNRVSKRSPVHRCRCRSAVPRGRGGPARPTSSTSLRGTVAGAAGAIHNAAPSK